MESELMIEHEKLLVKTAILFHDTEFKPRREGHEKRSAKRAEIELSKINIRTDDILSVKKIILATEFPRNPQNISEKVIADADICTLGFRTGFFDWTMRDYSEKYIYEEKIDLHKYLEGLVGFFADNDYYTRWAQQNLSSQKNTNLQLIKHYLETLYSKENESMKYKSTIWNFSSLYSPTKDKAEEKYSKRSSPSSMLFDYKEE
ncbi:hypothetical protein JW710_02705 [Candidatus Dojkabacteria bacterium]|nr:hypothetical protein [Candidatus Dojkabacteria bacterium]